MSFERTASTLDEAIRVVVLAALRDALPELRAELGRPRMIPIRETPVSYRRILEAEKAGELRVFRVGHAALVAEDELHAWIRRTGSSISDEVSNEPRDEVGELIELGEARRGRRRP